jgi:hypothetical protein
MASSHMGPYKVSVKPSTHNHRGHYPVRGVDYLTLTNESYNPVRGWAFGGAISVGSTYCYSCQTPLGPPQDNLYAPWRRHVRAYQSGDSRHTDPKNLFLISEN